MHLLPRSDRKEVNACNNRPSSGDIYLRMITPGTSPRAQERGGEWRWDDTMNKCLSSVQLMMATAPQSAGNCTQVSYVADNPGYNPSATVAAPLTHVVAQTGPACPAAAPPTPVQATPAAAPVTPAPTAPGQFRCGVDTVGKGRLFCEGFSGSQGGRRCSFDLERVGSRLRR
jgi:hypothetical protein